MLDVYTYSIISVLVISFVSFVGLFTLSLNKNLLKKYVFVLVSLAIGALLGDAFIHLLPQAFEKFANPLHVSLGVIAGILIFFFIEKVLHWHHHKSDEEHEGPPHTTGSLILVSDGFHNFIDGLIIAASYLVSIEIGIATTIAVVLHEIPQEIGDFGVLINSGFSRAKALWYNFVSALFAVAGAVFALAIGQATQTLSIWLLPIAAGGFIYIALSDLAPELHKEKRVGNIFLQLIAILSGVGAMLLLLGLE